MKDNETISAILNRVNRIAGKTATEREVTAEQLHNAAAFMARNGYKHTRVSLLALDEVLKGYNVLLSGNVGTGKTFFFRALNPEIKILDMNEAYLWKYDDLICWLNEHSGDDVVIDDIGAGAALSRNFGVAYDALMVALQRRITRSRAHTHFTTNLDNDGLIKAFDYRIVDRIYQLAKPFVMDRTESMRLPKPFYNH